MLSKFKLIKFKNEWIYHPLLFVYVLWLVPALLNLLTSGGLTGGLVQIHLIIVWYTWIKNLFVNRGKGVRVNKMDRLKQTYIPNGTLFHLYLFYVYPYTS